MHDFNMLTLEHYTKIHHHDTYPALKEAKTQNACKTKSVFITGAGTGIGKAIALSFARASADAVFLAGRTKATLEETQI
jgi:shikimate 5-dehydrogenase